MEVRPAGANALLIDVADPTAWYAELCRRRDAGELSAVDIVPGARTVLIDGVPDPGALAARLPGWTPPPARTEVGELVEIPVEYSGVDLPAVAERWGVPEAEAVGRLAGIEYRVAFCGFVPGFAYLTGLPPEWAVPRLETPRTRVPAGSVGLASGYAGIYPVASPGGWRLVGHTTVRLFDVDADPPALLRPGTRVRLAVRK